MLDNCKKALIVGNLLLGIGSQVGDIDWKVENIDKQMQNFGNQVLIVDNQVQNFGNEVLILEKYLMQSFRNYRSGHQLDKY